MSGQTPPITFLPVDLSRWDHGPGGDTLVVPVWSDVRPLRGAAGLLDWRLCGRLSQMIREGRVSGAAREKLLLVTSRIPWRRVLAVGVGESTAFCEDAFRSTVDCSLQALRGIGASSVAMALPGRDIDLIRPDRAVRHFMDALAQSEQPGGPWLERLTVIDAPSAAKTMSDASRTMPSAHAGSPE
jgi:Cytosol aminopeptidase family, N-terminal domain.